MPRDNNEHDRETGKNRPWAPEWSSVDRREFLLTLGVASAGATAGYTETPEEVDVSDRRTNNHREPVRDSREWSEVVQVTGEVYPTDTNCSGVLVREFQVLTAGHCIYDHETGKVDPDNLTVYPAVNTDYPHTYHPYDQANVSKIRVHPEFKESEQKGGPTDIALLTLDRSVGNDAAAGWRTIYTTDNPDDEMFEQQVQLIGYPGDEDPDDSMWLAPGNGDGTNNPNPTRLLADSMHKYDLAAGDGFSGGPVLNDDGQIVSIHSINDWGGSGPHGVWFPHDRYRWLINKISDDREANSDNPEEHPPYDMSMPVFDQNTWAQDANEEIIFEIAGEEFTSDEEPKIVAGEQTLKVIRDVRNVGPVAEGSLEIEFRLDRWGENREIGVVESKEEPDDGMPAPYETTTVEWEHTFSEEDIDNEYRVWMKIANVDPDEYRSTAALDLPEYLIQERRFPVAVIESHEDEAEDEETDSEDGESDESEDEEDEEPDTEDEDNDEDDESNDDGEESSITIQLIDAETAEAIPDGTVTLHPNRTGHSWGPETTNEDGIVVFENLGPFPSFDDDGPERLEVGSLQADAAGYEEAQQSLSWHPSDGPLDLTVELEADERDVERSVLTVNVVGVSAADYPEIPSVTVERDGETVAKERVDSNNQVQFSLEDGHEYTVSADGVQGERTVVVEGDTEITLSDE